MGATVSGPLFDGSASGDLDSALSEIRDTLAGQALADWHMGLNNDLKNPTPYYETQLNIMNTSDSAANVNDRRIIYGPWLEGLGSRNYPRTVFRGYSAMRKAAQTVQEKAQELCQPIIDRVLGKINGG